MGQRRFEVALFSFCMLLAGCGGGGAGAPSTTQALPPVISTPAPLAGPVAYLQNSGATSSGTIGAGTQQALVAIMSGASSTKSFANDRLTVATSNTAQTASRLPAVVKRAVAAPRVKSVEAFPADDRSLLARARALATGGSASSRRAENVFSSASVGTSADVWVQKGALGGSRVNVQVPATLLAQTAHMNIWVDSSLQFSQSELAQIGADAENAYASDTAHFASPDYPSNAPGLQPQYNACSASGAKSGTAPEYVQEPADHRIDLMVVNGQNLGGLGGYFSAANLMTQSTLNCLNASGTQQYESNGAPFIFVGWFASSGTTYDLQEDLVRSTAHELQHLINFVNHAILPSAASSSSFDGNEDQYINEGLSMLAQDLAVQNMYASRGVQFDVDDALSRANVYLSNPGAYSLSGFTGVDPVSWGGNGTAQYNCGGGCYGVAYLFQRYLRDRFGGDAYTRGMETSGLTGNNNLQNATRENASSLFGDFALAMAAGTLHVATSDPRFAFGTLDLSGTYADQFGASTALSGVYAQAFSSGAGSVSAPVGGFTFVSIGSVPQSGTGVTVTDQQTVNGFSLEGGLVQK